MDPSPPDDFQKALGIALRYLDSAPRTIAAVRTRLRRAGWDDRVIEGVIERLVDAELLDDRKFADAWVESRSRSRKLGPIRLSAELRRKGIAPELIAEALERHAPEDEDAAIFDLAKTLLGAADPADPDVRRRLGQRLLRRGHPWEAVKQVLYHLEAKDVWSDDC